MYQLKQVTDLENDELNSASNFNKVNIILEGTSIQFAFINDKNALQQLTVIQKSLEQEKDNDFLLEGI